MTTIPLTAKQQEQLKQFSASMRDLQSRHEAYLAAIMHGAQEVPANTHWQLSADGTAIELIEPAKAQ